MEGEVLEVLYAILNGFLIKNVKNAARITYI